MLVLLDEVVVATKLPQHVRHAHTAAVGLVEKMCKLIISGSFSKAQRKHRVGFDGQTLGVVSLFPKAFSTASAGSYLWRFDFSAGEHATLGPRFDLDAAV